MATQQETFDRGCEATRHVPEAVAPVVGPLIAWAAFNVGMARTGIGLVDKLATSQGWAELQQLLGLDGKTISELGALGSTSAAILSSIDLSAAACLRLAEVVSPAKQEFSMGSFENEWVKAQLARRPLSLNLQAWKKDLKSQNTWQLLKNCRDELVHRNPPQVNYAGTDEEAQLQSSEVVLKGVNHRIFDLVSRNPC